MENKKHDDNCICCDACNCTYHDGDRRCTASSIKVGCQDACHCGETFCGTFKLNEKATNENRF